MSDYRESVTIERRRWVDGPRWSWLCRIIGHQKKAWVWYSYCGLEPDWHRHALYCMEGQICRRCGVVAWRKP